MSSLVSLNKKREFDLVFQKGRKQVGFFQVIYLLKDTADNRCGIISSKKVGNAVKRNRSKRLIREAVRQTFSSSNTKAWLIIIARKSILKVKSQDVQLELFRLLSKEKLI